MVTPRKTTTASKPKTTGRVPAPKSATTPGASAAKAAVKPALSTGRVAAKPAAGAASGADGEMPTVLRKKEIIDTVVTRSGVKKKFAKPVLEAALAVLGEALAKGEELVLPPMGRIKVQRKIDKPNATVLVLRMRQTKRNKPAPKDPLAEAAE